MGYKLLTNLFLVLSKVGMRSLYLRRIAHVCVDLSTCKKAHLYGQGLGSVSSLQDLVMEIPSRKK